MLTDHRPISGGAGGHLRLWFIVPHRVVPLCSRVDSHRGGGSNPVQWTEEAICEDDDNVLFF